MNGTTLRGICTASVFFGLALSLLPEGRERRIASLCATAALVLMLIGLVRTVDWTPYSVSLAEMKSAADSISSDALERQSRMNRFVIERRCEEYIMDKAEELSLPLRSVRVSAKWSGEGVWFPDRVSITLAREAEGSERLSSLIEAQLGIEKKQQEWNIESEP